MKTIQKKYIFELSAASIIALIAMLTNNYPAYLACMLVSPILDAVDGTTRKESRIFDFIIALSLPALFGFIASFIVVTSTPLLNAAGVAYKNDLSKYFPTILIAITCGTILHLARSEPLIAVAINFATALLPQCIVLGYYLGAIIRGDSKYNLFDMLAALGVFITNVGGLIIGSMLRSIFINIQ